MYVNRADSSCTAKEEAVEEAEKGVLQAEVQNVRNQQIDAECPANSLCTVNLHYHNSPTSHPRRAVCRHLCTALVITTNCSKQEVINGSLYSV